MKKTFNLIFNTVLALLCFIGAVVSAVQLAMAIRYGELGRVVVYFGIAVLCIEMTVLSAIRIYRSKKGAKDSEPA